MKTSLLIALLALSIPVFAQHNPAPSLRLDPKTNSIHHTVRQTEKQQQLTGIFSPVIPGKGINPSSREPFGLVQQLDSTYSWQWDTLTNTWAIDSKYIDLLYNADNFLTSQTGQVWTGSSWENYLQFVHTYDANNNVTSSTYRSWTGSAWQNVFQTVYTYDANNDRTSETEQIWSGTAWMNSTKYLYTHDGNHNLTSEIDQEWDGAAWLNYDRYTYTYDANNKLTKDLYQSWDDINAVWVNEDQFLYVYDGNQNLTSATYQTWNGLSFDNSYLTTYTYDANNNQIGDLEQYWDNTTWVNNVNTANTYDANNNLTYSLTQGWNGASWDNAARINYTYDANHLLVKSLTEIWDGGSWLYTSLSFYTYTKDDFLQSYSFRSFDGAGDFVAYGDSTYNYFHTVTGINDLTTEDVNLSVYPNPSNGKFAVSSKGSLGEIEIFNFLGERVYAAKGVNGHITREINLTGYAKGIYLVIMTEGKKISSRKILIQ